MDKAKELRKQSIQELQQQLQEKRKELHALAVSHRVTPLKDPMSLRRVRRGVALLQTLLGEKGREKQLATETT